MATTIALDLNATLTITARCSECSGSGRVEPARNCLTCGRHYSADEIYNTKSELMPCGHNWTSLDESDWCEECEGTGKVQQTVTLAELFEAFSEMQRRIYP